MVFDKKNTSVMFGTESYRVSWQIFELKNNIFKRIHFSSFKINRIKNSLQNSAVMTRNSSNVKIAEIYQNYQNGTWQILEQALYAALTVLVTSESLGTGAIMAALNPIFFHQVSQTLPEEFNYINVSHNAGLSYTRYGIYYNALGYSYNNDLSFKDSYIFSFYQTMQFAQPISTNYTSSNAMLNYFEFSTGFTILNGGLGLFGGSLSEPIYIAEYK